MSALEDLWAETQPTQRESPTQTQIRNAMLQTSQTYTDMLSKRVRRDRAMSYLLFPWVLLELLNADINLVTLTCITIIGSILLASFIKLNGFVRKLARIDRQNLPLTEQLYDKEKVFSEVIEYLRFSMISISMIGPLFVVCLGLLGTVDADTTLFDAFRDDGFQIRLLIGTCIVIPVVSAAMYFQNHERYEEPLEQLRFSLRDLQDLRAGGA